MTKWKPIDETALRSKTSVLLGRRGRTGLSHTLYFGRHRTGYGHEPQPEILAWRADCCGRFASPTHYLLVGPPPDGDQSLVDDLESNRESVEQTMRLRREDEILRFHDSIETEEFNIGGDSGR